MIRLAGAAAATAVGAYLARWAASAFGDGPVFALIASWLIVSVVALVGQALPFHVPAAFYEFRAFERSGAVYERLGVRLFRRVVCRGPVSVFSPTLAFPQQPSLPALEQLDDPFTPSVFGHMGVVVVAGCVIVAVLSSIDVTAVHRVFAAAPARGIGGALIVIALLAYVGLFATPAASSWTWPPSPRT